MSYLDDDHGAATNPHPPKDPNVASANEPYNFTPYADLVCRPIEPSAGTVLGFTKQFSANDKAYAFAAISVGTNMWFLSGPRHGGSSMHWSELLNFIGGPEQWAQVGVAVVWQKGLL